MFYEKIDVSERVDIQMGTYGDAVLDILIPNLEPGFYKVTYNHYKDVLIYVTEKNQGYFCNVFSIEALTEYALKNIIQNNLEKYSEEIISEMISDIEKINFRSSEKFPFQHCFNEINSIKAGVGAMIDNKLEEMGIAPYFFRTAGFKSIEEADNFLRR